MFFRKLLFLFIIIPVIELYILIEIGRRLGVWYAIGIIVLTGVLGAYLVKGQGFYILKKIQIDLNEGILPGDNLIQALIILVGGVLLITPGFLTDIMGLICLVPPGRLVIKNYLLKWLKSKIQEGSFYYKEY